MYKNLVSHLNENLEKWLMSLLPGLFMFLVLFVYRAYNIQQSVSFSGHSLIFRSIVISFATSLLFYLSEFYARPYFKIKQGMAYSIWTLGIVLIGINITFLIFNYFWLWTELIWKSYLLFYYEYPLIICFPIILAQLIAKGINRSAFTCETLMVFESENRKSSLSIKPEQLLFLQSADNYVQINFLERGVLKKHLIRTSLKEIEGKHISSPYLKRCHRSFMVNPKNIDTIIKNSKITNLKMASSNIPVSKKYQAHF